MREQFPELSYVASPGYYPVDVYHHATWSGISEDCFHVRWSLPHGQSCHDLPLAGSFLSTSGATGQPMPIQNFDQQKASFMVLTCTVMPPGIGTIYVSLAVSDHGSPRLTRYRRVILEVIE